MESQNAEDNVWTDEVQVNIVDLQKLKFNWRTRYCVDNKVDNTC